MITVLITEDQTMFRDSLERLINAQEDMRVVGSIVNADDALESCRKLSPKLALLDVVTGNSANGISTAARIHQELPDVKLVILTALPEITFVDAAQKAGVHSFVYKNADSQHLLYVIRSTMKGQGIYPGPAGTHPFKTTFSDAELAIIRLACQGKSRGEIAATLDMSEGSVKGVITVILNKTGFDSIMKFAVYAVAHGLILPHHDA